MSELGAGADLPRGLHSTGGDGPQISFERLAEEVPLALRSRENPWETAAFRAYSPRSAVLAAADELSALPANASTAQRAEAINAAAERVGQKFRLRGHGAARADSFGTVSARGAQWLDAASKVTDEQAAINLADWFPALKLESAAWAATRTLDAAPAERQVNLLAEGDKDIRARDLAPDELSDGPFCYLMRRHEQEFEVLAFAHTRKLAHLQAEQRNRPDDAALTKDIDALTARVTGLASQFPGYREAITLARQLADQDREHPTTFDHHKILAERAVVWQARADARAANPDLRAYACYDASTALGLLTAKYGGTPSAAQRIQWSAEMAADYRVPGAGAPFNHYDWDTVRERIQHWLDPASWNDPDDAFAKSLLYPALALEAEAWLAKLKQEGGGAELAALVNELHDTHAGLKDDGDDVDPARAALADSYGDACSALDQERKAFANAARLQFLRDQLGKEVDMSGIGLEIAALERAIANRRNDSDYDTSFRAAETHLGAGLLHPAMHYPAAVERLCAVAWRALGEAAALPMDE